MSVLVMTQVFRRSRSALAARLVLLALADAAHDDGVSWLDQDTIAEKANVSRASVIRVVKELEESGELETRKAQRGRRRINVYRVCMPGLLDVDYDRLPFDVKTPFTATSQYATPSGDDVASCGPTTSHPEDSTRAPHTKDPKGNRQGANAPNAREAELPDVATIDGRNVPLDTLASVCGVAPDSPRFIQAVVALNGRRTPRTKELTEPGIRHLFWNELLRWADDEHGDPGRPDALRVEPERFELALARGIRRKASIYRERMPGAALTPKALRDWWLDLELLPEPGGDGGISADDIASYTDG